MEDSRMHVRIVPMNADHLDEVAELERICFSDPWSRNMLAEELNNMLSAFLVALDDTERVVGYAGVQVVLDEGYITNVAVFPAAHRRGAAKALLAELAAYGAAHGLCRITLEVRVSNAPAIALYEGAGYVRDGVRPKFYSHPTEDAAIYSLYF